MQQTFNPDYNYKKAENQTIEQLNEIIAKLRADIAIKELEINNLKRKYEKSN